LKNCIARPVTAWADSLVNDFEGPVFRAYPILLTIKQQLYDRSAIYASLTGSGSSLFGIFEKGNADTGGWDPDYRVIVAQ
jgi:4-diphosphocytidyl-2-C-methyl-D-erythritol kinase